MSTNLGRFVEAHAQTQFDVAVDTEGVRLRRLMNMATTPDGSADHLLLPPAFVWCIAGPHIGETLPDIVERKQRDIDRFGWCLWAYGGMGNAHPETEVRRLAGDYLGGEPLPLLMPDTGKSYPDIGQAFDGYRIKRSNDLEPIPAAMSPVTGGRSSWAFWVTSLRWSPTATIDISSYVAPYARSGPQPLADYLRGSHGRACAARVDGNDRPVHERRVHVVAQLGYPHAVFLGRTHAIGEADQ